MRDGASLEPVGILRSSLRERAQAPRQGAEGAPDAWLEVSPEFADAALGVVTGLVRHGLIHPVPH